MIEIVRRADRIVPVADLEELPLSNIASRIAEAKLTAHGCYSFTVEGEHVLFVHSTAALLRTIEALQFMQKRISPSAPEWETLAAQMSPLFEEMARRQAAGDPLAN